MISSQIYTTQLIFELMSEIRRSVEKNTRFFVRPLESRWRSQNIADVNIMIVDQSGLDKIKDLPTELKSRLKMIFLLEDLSRIEKRINT